MSYLSSVRLHFTGTFRANPATVNNDVRHFNNGTFKERYQELQEPGGNSNGWWNPRGANSFRLSECRVTRLCYADGTHAAPGADDPVSSMIVRDAADRSSAKIVDLDPEQQFVTQIWGLEINVVGGARTAIKGPFVPVSFSDMWWERRAPVYQSVISAAQIDHSIKSRFLEELARETADGMLSMKFVVDHYSAPARGFTYGRIYGTIGPQSTHEPRHCVAGRYIRPPSANPSDPTNRVFFVPAVLDAKARKVRLDFGNALRTTDDPVAVADIGDLVLGHLAMDGSFVPLDAVGYGVADWYENTAGICDLPKDRPLSDAEMTDLSSKPLALAVSDARGQPAIVASENRSGLFVRPDKFTFRINPGDTEEVRLVATRFGKPAGGIEIVCIPTVENFGIGSIGDEDEPDLPLQPLSGVPADAVSYRRSVTTDAQGQAIVTINTRDPGTPRFLDGQLYGVAFYPREVLVEDGESLTLDPEYRHNPLHALSILVWSATADAANPTWFGDVQPIFETYANLYPIMKDIVDLNDYDSVVKNRHLILKTMSLDDTHPNYMPVTRDLSRAKKQIVLRWLRSAGADGLPPKGHPASPSVAGPGSPAGGTRGHERNFVPVPQAKVTPIMRSKKLKLTRDFKPMS